MSTLGSGGGNLFRNTMLEFDHTQINDVISNSADNILDLVFDVGQTFYTYYTIFAFTGPQYFYEFYGHQMVIHFKITISDSDVKSRSPFRKG